jgi:hypothetical protein
MEKPESSAVRNKRKWPVYVLLLLVYVVCNVHYKWFVS